MNIETALARVNTLRPNSVSDQIKVSWLSECDGLVHREIILNHEHGPELDTFGGYDEGTDRSTELLVPYPYDEIYIHYLAMKIDYATLETDKYNNDRALFNNAWDTFGDWWRRNNMPIQRCRELRI